MRGRQISYIISCLILYFGFSYSGYRVFLVSLVVLVLLALAGLAELYWIRSRVQLSQTLEPDPVYTGDAAQLVIEITSRTILPIPVLEIVTEQKRSDTLKSACLTEIPDRSENGAASAGGTASNGMNTINAATAAGSSAAAQAAAATVEAEALRGGRVRRLDWKARLAAWLRPLPGRIRARSALQWNQLLCELKMARQSNSNKPAILLRHHRLTSMIGRGRFRETIRLRTEDPRIYEVSACHVTIQDPFGLFRLPLYCLVAGAREGLRLHVLPRPNEKLMIHDWLQNTRDGFNASQRVSDEVNAVADLHQMNPGDSFRRIHWVVSAKQNKWMIKRFEKDEQAHVLLLPDLGAGHVPERLQAFRRDMILGLTAAAVQQLLESSLSVLLVTSDRSLRSSFASRSDQLLDLLIHLAAAPDQTDDPLRHQALEGLARMPDDAMVVFVTATPDDTLSMLAADLIKTGHVVTVIYYENPLLAPPDPARQLDRLTASGVSLIRIPEDNPSRLRHPERRHGARKTADGWSQVRRGVTP